MPINDDQKREVIALWKTSLKPREIVEKTGFTRHQVYDAIQQYKKFGTIERKYSSGRPPKFNSREVRIFKRFVNDNPDLTFTEMRSQLEEIYSMKMSERTFKSMLDRLNIHPKTVVVLKKRN